MKPDVRVDILTPVYGHPDLLKLLMESLFQHDAGTTWHWWVIDDNGPKTPELLEVYEAIKKDERCNVIISPKNRGFAGANNDAARRGKAPLILLLNSDTRIMENDWLGKMAKEFDDQQVGIVGAKLLYFTDSTDPDRPAGSIQHAGVVFNLIGQPYHIYIKWSGNNHWTNERRDDFNAVTGACLMTRRKLYEKLNGLDEIFGQGNFEDVKFCVQARKLGFKIVYNPQVVLEHFHGGSGNKDVAEKNEILFRMMCADIIEYDDYRHWCRRQAT